MPRRRPQRCNSGDAQSIDVAVPTTTIAVGIVASFGVEAMRAPSRPLTSTIIEVLDIPNACVAASTQTLAGRRGMGVAVIGLYNGTAPAGFKLNAAGARTRAMVNAAKGTRRSWRSSRD